MGCSKYLCLWVPQGVQATNGNIMTFWKTNFNMPVPCMWSGPSDMSNGFISVRNHDLAFTSQALPSFQPGFELAVADSLYVYCVSDGSRLCGTAGLYLGWWRSGGCGIGGGVTTVSINITAPAHGWSAQWYESMQNTGIAGWEVASPPALQTLCVQSCAVTCSGDNVSIPNCCITFDIGSIPATAQCSSTLRGSIWVDSLSQNLNYINANCWQQYMIGVDNGLVFGSCPGSLWIDNSHYLHWIGSNSHDYSACWRICQFCSTFTNGAPVNPAPGAACMGKLWMDSQFGSTHLAYIGCDGNKYLTGGGCYPYQLY